MRKRQFIIAGASLAALSRPTRSATAGAPTGPVLLTVAGAIPRGNRPPLDAALEPLMAKHGAKFERAWAFDAAMLARLPAVTIQPTLEYDAKPHRLRGPLLTTVVEAAGVAPGAAVLLGLRALDGYTVAVTLADAKGYAMIVATAMDGAPLGIGGLGPLWAVYDADRLPAFKDKPLKQRFGLCPWGLYFIDVKSS